MITKNSDGKYYTRSEFALFFGADFLRYWDDASSLERRVVMTHDSDGKPYTKSEFALFFGEGFLRHWNRARSYEPSADMAFIVHNCAFRAAHKPREAPDEALTDHVFHEQPSPRTSWARRTLCVVVALQRAGLPEPLVRIVLSFV